MDSFPRPLKALGRLLASGLVLGIAGCAIDPQRAAEYTLQDVGSTVLRREAAIFYKQLFRAPPQQYFLPQVNDCPPSFRQFNPRRVRAYDDGFALALSDARGAEEGLYVMPLGMDQAPRDNRNATFQRIEDGIYWYSFSE